MELKIFNPQEDEDNEQQVYLKLVKYEDYVVLEACDEHGDRIPRGSLVVITSDGTTSICGFMNPMFKAEE